MDETFNRLAIVKLGAIGALSFAVRPPWSRKDSLVVMGNLTVGSVLRAVRI